MSTSDDIFINGRLFIFSKELLIKNSPYFKAACDVLTENGLRIKITNFHPSAAAIDIVLKFINNDNNMIITDDNIIIIIRNYDDISKLMEYFQLPKNKCDEFQSSLYSAFLHYDNKVPLMCSDLMSFNYPKIMYKWFAEKDNLYKMDIINTLIQEPQSDNKNKMINDMIEHNINPLIELNGLTNNFKNSLEFYSDGLFDDHLLDLIDWENTIIAGGTIVNCLNNTFYKWSDIDLWVFGENVIRNVLHLLHLLTITTEKKYDKSVCYSMNRNVITIYCAEYNRNIQIIYTSQTPEKIIEDFDEDYVKAYYNGNSVMGKLEFVRSFMNKSIYKIKKPTKQRFIKGLLKGYENKLSKDDDIYQLKLADISKFKPNDNDNDHNIYNLSENEMMISNIVNKYFIPTQNDYSDPQRMFWMVNKIYGHNILCYDINDLMKHIESINKDFLNVSIYGDSQVIFINKNHIQQLIEKLPETIHVSDTICTASHHMSLNKITLKDGCTSAPFVIVTEAIQTAYPLCWQRGNNGMLKYYDGLKILRNNNGSDKLFNLIKILDDHFGKIDKIRCKYRPSIKESMLLEYDNECIKSKKNKNRIYAKLSLIVEENDKDSEDDVKKVKTKLLVDGKYIEANASNLKKYVNTGVSQCKYTIHVSHLVTVSDNSYGKSYDKIFFLQFICHQIEVISYVEEETDESDEDEEDEDEYIEDDYIDEYLNERR